MKGLWTRLYRKILKKNVGLTWCGENFFKKIFKRKEGPSSCGKYYRKNCRRKRAESNIKKYKKIF